MFFLISPIENYRICDIRTEPLPVPEPLFWFLVEDFDPTKSYVYLPEDRKMIAIDHFVNEI